MIEMIASIASSRPFTHNHGSTAGQPLVGDAYLVRGETVARGDGGGATSETRPAAVKVA